MRATSFRSNQPGDGSGRRRPPTCRRRDARAGGRRGALGGACASRPTLCAPTRCSSRSSLIWIFFQWASRPTGSSFSPRNFSNLMQQMAVTGVLAVGMLMVIVAGQIDLSVGSVVGLAGGVAAMTQELRGVSGRRSRRGDRRRRRSSARCRAALVAYANIPAFIVTLGGLLAWRGVILGSEQGRDDPRPRCRSSGGSAWASCRAGRRRRAGGRRHRGGRRA